MMTYSEMEMMFTTFMHLHVWQPTIFIVLPLETFAATLPIRWNLTSPSLHKEHQEEIQLCSNNTMNEALFLILITSPFWLSLVVGCYLIYTAERGNREEHIRLQKKYGPMPREQIRGEDGSWYMNPEWLEWWKKAHSDNPFYEQMICS